MELTKTQQEILKTIVFFDLLDYPLTLVELINFCQDDLTTGEIFNALNSELLIKLIGQRDGFYFLSGREAILNIRHQRYRLALKKLKLASRYARFFGYFPWIKAMAIYSSLSLKNSRRSGDFDFFIITDSNRTWSARFFINLILKIFRLRPTPGNSADKICASYWVSENNLNLSPLNCQNDYFHHYYGCWQFVFLSGSPETVNKFYQANSWLNQTLPNWQPIDWLKKTKSSATQKFIQKLAEKIFGLASEKFYHDYQLKILPQKYLDNNDGQKVVLQNDLIKLHDNDKRDKYNRLFEESYAKILAQL
jgi:hypothetical protein